MVRIVQAHGPAAAVAALVKAVPRQVLADACDAAWGVRRDDPDEHARRMAFGEATVVLTPQTAPTRSNIGMLDRRHPAGGAAVPFGAAPGIVPMTCWSCKPDYGEGPGATCAAITLLNEPELQAELEALRVSVDQDEAEAGVSAQARRAARYCMYRHYVREHWGTLGRGKRIRLPRCVVEAIRDTFREPDCKCKLGGPLFACTAHGYTGHRDAPAATSE